MSITVKSVTEIKKDDAQMLGMRPRIFGQGAGIPLRRLRGLHSDDFLIGVLHRWSIPALRVALGVVFLWFGALKLLGVSPVLSLVRQAFPFLPLEPFFFLLSLWEVWIGCALIFRWALRFTLALLLLHLVGTFTAVWLEPSLFFLKDNPLLLTTLGEFVVKNLVLVAAGFVIGGYELRPRNEGDK